MLDVLFLDSGVQDCDAEYVASILIIVHGLRLLTLVEDANTHWRSGDI